MIRTTVPEAVILSQNYPNPFNPSTVIDYTLAGDMDVRLDIFSVLGQKMNTLVDTHKASGIHRVHYGTVRMIPETLLRRVSISTVCRPALPFSRKRCS